MVPCSHMLASWHSAEQVVRYKRGQYFGVHAITHCLPGFCHNSPGLIVHVCSAAAQTALQSLSIGTCTTAIQHHSICICLPPQVHYAGLNEAIAGKDFKHTVFVPNNKAFVARLQLTGGVVPSVARTAEVLKYHVVPGIHALPKGFKDGQSVETLLKGQNLTVTYEM